jgi:predicted amino acid-binding ACT domain protein
MNNIGLNHVLMTHKIDVLATSLLVIGNVLSIALFLYCHQLTSETAFLQIDMRQRSEATNKPNLNRSLLQINVKEHAIKHDEITAVNAAIKEIVLPWPALFKSLEAVDSAEVKLLALEPNAKQRTLHITAVALDVDGMMRYVRGLTQQSVLKEVVLQSQETTEINGQAAIRFVIGAAWKA